MKTQPFQERKRMTALAEEVAKRISAQGKPILTNYELFGIIWGIYREGDVRYLRGETPSQGTFDRTRMLLKSEGILRRDHDYTRMWRNMAVGDVSADEIVCAADPTCYISHMSAMQIYGITDRRPEALSLVQPDPATRKAMVDQRFLDDYGQSYDAMDVFVEKLTAVKHPADVRSRPLDIMVTRYHGDNIDMRRSYERVATIGQTFLDMLESPERCGGMIHVLDVWQEHARLYLEEIIEAVERAPKKILKVRAGYILSELMHVADVRIEAWQQFAQRGGSRVLNSAKPFVGEYSEQWMISLNA